MVAVINTSSSLRNTLHYNENKLKEKAAKLIHASGYAKDTELLGFTDKLLRLQKLAELNERTKVNSIHISLNFDPSEKLPETTLRKIAHAYMQKLGFGKQPYLVYEHHDAGHPHIHIVSTNIQTDGSRIKLHNIGRNQSEKARKEIEKDFRLVKADDRHQKQAHEVRPVNAQKVLYGRSATKRAITNVLDAILPVYKFTSLAELNAILKQYNVVADQGGKDSRIYKNNGLVFRVLDEKGEKVGVPVPASHIYNKPTMKFLTPKFQDNDRARQPYKLRVKNAVDLAILKRPGLLVTELMAALQKEKIQLVLRQNNEGIIYGLTYVDHQTKCVFNGSDLGKAYSANQLLERLRNADPRQRVQPPEIRQRMGQTETGKSGNELIVPGTSVGNFLEKLFQPEEPVNSLAAELKGEKKRKRRKKLR